MLTSPLKTIRDQTADQLRNEILAHEHDSDSPMREQALGDILEAMKSACKFLDMPDIVGSTDEIGSCAVECVHPIRDLHVTLLHLLGLDDNKLTYRDVGR